MSKRKSDEIVAVVTNTDVKHKIWDRPESGQGERRHGPLSDSVRFVPGASVGVTAEQLAHMGKPPAGVTIDRYDERKHKNVKRMG